VCDGAEGAGATLGCVGDGGAARGDRGDAEAHVAVQGRVAQARSREVTPGTLRPHMAVRGRAQRAPRPHVAVRGWVAWAGRARR
jgi:hypothetical protein